VGLFRRSAAAAEIVVSPAVVVPRQTVQATITTQAPIDDVRTATIDWGYTNFYRYHWAGRLDSAGNASDDLLMLGNVGTNYGGDRNADEWVSVIKQDLPLATGEFTGTTAQFKIPSWAPASSEEIARWSCRLTLDRGGRDVDAHADFTVVVRPEDVDAGPEPVEQVDGAGETLIEISVPSVAFRAGEPIRGQITLRPTKDLPNGDLAVSWQRHRESHPLTRRPSETGPIDGPIVHLGKGIPLRAGSPITVPFEVVLPVDAAPTAAAVHSSMSWFVAARLFYAGFTSHTTERVRHPIVVVNGVG